MASAAIPAPTTAVASARQAFVRRFIAVSAFCLRSTRADGEGRAEAPGLAALGAVAAGVGDRVGGRVGEDERRALAGPAIEQDAARGGRDLDAAPAAAERERRVTRRLD